MTSPDYIISFLRQLVTPSVNEFDDRLTVQKLIYIAQKCGTDFGFTFGWYINGPYSPSLAREVYPLRDSLGILHGREISLEDRDEYIARKIRTTLQTRMSDPAYLEMIASLWYYLPVVATSNAQDRALNTVLLLKPQFKRGDLEEALKLITKLRSN